MMPIKKLLLYVLLIVQFDLQAQKNITAKKWVETQFKKLTNDEKIAQLFIIRAHSNWSNSKIDSVKELIKKYNVGGICFFQGDPINQALITNQFQQSAKTPLFISIDAEWGLAMRLDNVIPLPKNMQIGALENKYIHYAYDVGKTMALQCKRLGIQINYAPDADINNNSQNPVINERSFGENKYKVSLFATQCMQGLQENGVMACAKHFPGHGDVQIDSHNDLPLINKSKDSLENFELYPFKTLINKGIDAVMVAHLNVPSLDSQKNKPSSLSEKTIQQLLINELQFKGLVITDALEMKAIKNYYPDNTAATQAIIAGNDLLCLPADINGTINQIKLAIRNKQLNWQIINQKVKKILYAKYKYGLHNFLPIDTNNLLYHLNKYTAQLNDSISSKTLTVPTLVNKNGIPLNANKKYLIVAFGGNDNQIFTNNFANNNHVFTMQLPYTIDNNVLETIQKILPQFDYVFISLHAMGRRPQNNFGVSNPVIQYIQKIQQPNFYLFCFGNPYILSNFSNYKNVIVMYEDTEFTQRAATNFINGKLIPAGKLPVSIPNFFY